MSKLGQAILQQNDFLREIVGRTSANIGIIFAILVAILITFILNKTTKGYQLRAVGLNLHSKAAGINVKETQCKPF